MSATDRIANAQQCPYCRGWITLPLRRARASFEAHKLACRQTVPGAVQVPEPRDDYPTFCQSCHEPRNSAELSESGSCFRCVGRAYPPHPYWSTEPCTQPGCDERAETVQRATLWDGIQDTHQTEAELNGFRATQGALL